MIKDITHIIIAIIIVAIVVLLFIDWNRERQETIQISSVIRQVEIETFAFNLEV